MGRRAVDLTGMTFERWHVEKRVPKPPYIEQKYAYYLCRCVCGRYGVVSSANLRSGMSKSCGCLRVDRLMERHIQRREQKARAAC